jgi:hypothetical protein
MWRAILIISPQNSAAEGKFKPTACDQELGIGFVTFSPLGASRKLPS